MKSILVYLLIITMLLLSNVSHCTNLAKETISPEELQMRVKLYNEWYHKINPSSEHLEAVLDQDNKLVLKSKDDIAEDSTIITVSREQIITNQNIYETKYGETLKEVEETYGFDDVANIALFLIVEKHNPESKWKPYLDILPSKPLSLLWNYWDNKTWVEGFLLNTSLPSKPLYIIYLYYSRKNIRTQTNA